MILHPLSMAAVKARRQDPNRPASEKTPTPSRTTAETKKDGNK